MISHEQLTERGFKQVGKQYIKTVYRYEPKSYPFHFQFSVMDLPETNPNCGVLAIYFPEQEIHAVPKDLIQKQDWTVEDVVRAANNTIKIDDWYQNIAYYLHDVNRLDAIIKNLCYEKEKC